MCIKHIGQHGRVHGDAHGHLTGLSGVCHVKPQLIIVN